MKNEMHSLASTEQIREAIDSLSYLISGECTGNQMDFVPDIALAIIALEKHIPKSPEGRHTDFKCPACGRRVRSGKGSSSHIRDNVCQRCFQVLDWEGNR